MRYCANIENRKQLVTLLISESEVIVIMKLKSLVLTLTAAIMAFFAIHIDASSR